MVEPPAHNRIVVGSRPAGSTIFFPKRRTEIFLSAFFLCVEGVSVVRRRRGRGEAEGLRERGAARMRDGRCRRACEGHRRGEAKRGVPPLLRKGRGRLHGTKGMRRRGVHAAERAEEKTPPIGDSEGKACGRRRRKELRPEKRTVVFRSGRALQQDFSRSVISSTSGTPRPLASFSMVASVGEEGLRPSSF